MNYVEQMAALLGEQVAPEELVEEGESLQQQARGLVDSVEAPGEAPPALSDEPKPVVLEAPPVAQDTQAVSLPDMAGKAKLKQRLRAMLDRGDRNV